MRGFAACLRCALLAVAMLCAHAAFAETAKFDPARDAAADVAAAVAEARATHRRVLVDVGGEWCIWCHYLDAFFERDTEARALRDRDYVAVKVNWSPENHNTAVLSHWPAIDGYPHLFVLDADGALVRSQSTEPLEEGRGYSHARMMAFLARYAAPSRAPR
jgi:thiol:disulfide interchange protein